MKKQIFKKRKGDTGRTSNQGRKQSSGGSIAKKKGNTDINEDTKNEVKAEKAKEMRVPAGAVTR